LVKSVASKCPHDYIIVLTDYNGVKNLFRHLRSSYYQGVCALNTADDHLVYLHEMGHAIALFADEYVFQGGVIDWDAPNCDPKEGCPMFSSVSTADCVLGCTNMKHRRSTEKGIMRNYWEPGGQTFGDYNELYLAKLLKEETKGSPITSYAVKEDNPKEIVIMDLRYQNGEIFLGGITKTTGFSPKYNFDKGFKVVLGENSFNIGYPNKYFDDGPENGILTGGLKGLYSVEFSLVIDSEIVEDQPSIKILDDKGGVVGDFYLAEKTGERIFYPYSSKTIPL
jgi:hypothetical protein